MKGFDFIMNMALKKQFVKENYNNMDCDTISKKIGITKSTIEKWAKEMGIYKYKRQYTHYSKEYIENYIKENHSKLSQRQISKDLGIATTTVTNILKKLDLYIANAPRGYIPTKDDIEFVKKNIDKLSKNSIMKELGIPYKALNKLIKDLNIDKTYEYPINPLPDNKIEYIYKNYRRLSAEEIATKLGCNVSTVYKYIGHRRKKNFNQWSNEEKDILIESWSKNTVQQIKKKLARKGYLRTEKAIKGMAKTLKLVTDITFDGEYYTTRDISEIVGISISAVSKYYKNGIINSSLFKGKRRTSYDDFKSFLKNNQDKWNCKDVDLDIIKGFFSDFKLLAETNGYNLEVEQWLLNKIDKDFSTSTYKRREWTLLEVKKLNKMRSNGATYKEIAKALNRSVSSIETKFNEKKHVKKTA